MNTTSVVIYDGYIVTLNNLFNVHSLFSITTSREAKFLLIYKANIRRSSSDGKWDLENTVPYALWKTPCSGESVIFHNGHVSKVRNLFWII